MTEESPPLDGCREEQPTVCILCQQDFDHMNERFDLLEDMLKETLSYFRRVDLEEIVEKDL